MTSFQSRDVLMTNRAELNKQLTNLRSQSRLTMTGSDRTKMDRRRKELQTELDAANAQIQSLPLPKWFEKWHKIKSDGFTPIRN